MGLSNEETIKLPQDLEDKISRIRAQTAISEQEAIDLRNAVTLLKDEVSSLQKQRAELSDNVAKVQTESDKKELELSVLSTNYDCVKQDVTEKRLELNNLVNDITREDIKRKEEQDKMDKRVKELSDIEENLNKRESDLALKENEYSEKVGKMADFISNL